MDPERISHAWSQAPFDFSLYILNQRVTASEAETDRFPKSAVSKQVGCRWKGEIESQKTPDSYFHKFLLPASSATQEVSCACPVTMQCPRELPLITESNTFWAAVSGPLPFHTLRMAAPARLGLPGIRPRPVLPSPVITGAQTSPTPLLAAQVLEDTAPLTVHKIQACCAF